MDAILPAFPCYTHDPEQPMRVALKSDLHVSVLAWAMVPTNWHRPTTGELWYASLTEKYYLLRAGWATINDGGRRDKFINMPTRARGYRQTFACYKPEGKDVYHTSWNDTTLPKAGGYSHLLLLHQSMQHPKANAPFMHLSLNNADPQLDEFFLQLDRVLTIGLDGRWTEQLWHEGLAKKLIRQMPSHNCVAWWIDPNEDSWSLVTTRLIAGSHAQLSVTSHGLSKPKPDEAIVEEASDTDEEE